MRAEPLRCSICLRPKPSQQLEPGERACHTPGGLNCYRLGFERLNMQVEGWAEQLRGIGARVDEVVAGMPEEEGGP